MQRKIESALSILISMILLAIIIFNNRIKNEPSTETKNNFSNTSNSEIYSNEIDTEERKELEREIKKANQEIKYIFNNQVSNTNR